MFEDDKEEWHQLFDYYKQHFGEDVGVMCGVLDTDDFEIDLFAGEDSGKIFGLRLYQVMELEEKDKTEALKEDKAMEKGRDVKAGQDEEEEEKEEEEEDDDEEELSEVMAYDLVLKPNAKILGKVACKATLDLTEEGKEGEREDARKLAIKIYTEDGDVNAYVTGVVGTFEGNPASRLVFLEPPELK